MAVDGIAKGRQYTSQTKLGQLWASVWDEYEACLSNGIQIEVHKVKSHEGEDSTQLLHHTWGNDCADYHAKRCAREHQPSDRELAETASIDAEAWLIQDRMLAAIEAKPKVHKDRDAIQKHTPVITSITEQLKQLGHVFIHRVTPQSPYKCMLCGQQWS